MYLNDWQRGDFYRAIGLDPKKFDKYVIKKTNENSGKLFPVILDVENPKFFEALDRCADYNLELDKLSKGNNNSFGSTIKKFYYTSLIALNLLELYLLPVIDTEENWATAY